jgi:hypothetical protein
MISARSSGSLARSVTTKRDSVPVPARTPGQRPGAREDSAHRGAGGLNGQILAGLPSVPAHAYQDTEAGTITEIDAAQIEIDSVDRSAEGPEQDLAERTDPGDVDLAGHHHGRSVAGRMCLDPQRGLPVTARRAGFRGGALVSACELRRKRTF